MSVAIDHLCSQLLMKDGQALRIRRMTEDDLDIVMRIEQSVFLSPWSRPAFVNEISENQLAVPLVAVVDKMICGYLVAWVVMDELHIGTIAVDKAWQRHGIATILLKEIFQIALSSKCRIAYLEVRQSNLAAQRLYERFGFQRIGIRPKYYSPQHEDAIVMAKPLVGGEEENGLV